MFTLVTFVSLTPLFLSSWGAALPSSNTGPVVNLKYGSFQGNATGDLVEFLGMPFAAPPYVSYSIFDFDDHIDKFLLSKVLGISDLLLRNHLWNSLESARLLVLEMLARSKH